MNAVSVDKAGNPALVDWLLCYRRGKVPYHLSSRWYMSLCESFDISYKLLLLLRGEFLLVGVLDLRRAH